MQAKPLSPNIPTSTSPQVIPRAEHPISRSQINEHALKVLYKLKDAGFRACLVGGGVRDLLLGREPKDFDVATDAHPEQVRQLFRNCRLIGRRFRLAHVFFGREIIEVATFRAALGDEPADGRPRSGALLEDGRIIRDNVYGTIEQDAWRRDFSVNALYYDIHTFSVIDYTGGMDDLKRGVLRLIGDPLVRFREDPVRLLRAVRFAAKLGFKLDPATEYHLPRLGYLLDDVSSARLFDEAIKLFQGGYGVQTFEMLRHYDLFGCLFAQTEEALTHEEHGFPLTFVVHALRSTDERIATNKPVNPAFLYAALLWEPVRLMAEAVVAKEGCSMISALQLAGDAVLRQQMQRTSIPRHLSTIMREIWSLQPGLLICKGPKVFKIMAHPRFRAAYDFFCLRAQAGEVSEELCQWWTQIQTLNEAEQKRMAGLAGPTGKKRKKRKKRPATSKAVQNQTPQPGTSHAP